MPAVASRRFHWPGCLALRTTRHDVRRVSTACESDGHRDYGARDGYPPPLLHTPLLICSFSFPTPLICVNSHRTYRLHTCVHFRSTSVIHSCSVAACLKNRKMFADMKNYRYYHVYLVQMRRLPHHSPLQLLKFSLPVLQRGSWYWFRNRGSVGRKRMRMCRYYVCGDVCVVGDKVLTGARVRPGAGGWAPGFGPGHPVFRHHTSAAAGVVASCERAAESVILST